LKNRAEWVLLSFEAAVGDVSDLRRKKCKRGYQAMPKNETKLLFPSLAGFYETALPIAATFVRIVVGVMFLMHVSGKFTAGPA
jgi:hypothetical protein